MQRKSLKRMIVLLFIIILGINHKLYASGMGSTSFDTEESMSVEETLKQQMNLLNWEDIKSLQQDLNKDSNSLQNFNLQEEVQKLIIGEKRFSVESLLGVLGEMFFGEIKDYMHIIVRFVLIVFLCSMLQMLSSAFESKNTTKVAFFVCYLVIIYSVIQSLVMLVALANEVVHKLNQIMAVTLPTLLAFMTTSGYITSSTALMPVIVGALNICAFMVQKLILPMIVGIVILQVISSMNEEIKIDKLIELFYSTAKFALRGILFLSMAIMSIYRVILPVIDMGIKKSAVQFSTAFIPVIGDAANSAIHFVLLCAGQIKNSFAVGVILWIAILAVGPLVKMFTCVVLYKVAGALIQPIGDKKMANIATQLAKGCEFVMSCVGSVAILCILAMVICISVGSSLI